MPPHTVSCLVVEQEFHDKLWYTVFSSVADELKEVLLQEAEARRRAEREYQAIRGEASFFSHFFFHKKLYLSMYETKRV